MGPPPLQTGRCNPSAGAPQCLRRKCIAEAKMLPVHPDQQIAAGFALDRVPVSAHTATIPLDQNSYRPLFLAHIIAC